MDPINNRDNLFSRGPSPPPQTQQQLFSQPLVQLNDPNAPSASHRDNVTSASSHLDSLFHNLAAPPPRSASPQAQNVSNNNNFIGPQDIPASGPATPASVNAGSVTSSGSVPSNQTTERQNALLSLLGAVSSPSSNSQTQPIASTIPPQQVPTPPGSAPRAGPSNESQTKLLLEQLMSGNPNKYNSDNASANVPLPTSNGPSPTYLPSLGESQTHPEGDFYGGESSFGAQDASRESTNTSQQTIGQAQSIQQRPPSPARRSMFDFVSPFDALQGSTTGQVKRKPPPPQTTNAEEPWGTPPPVDPRRKSVENLMDQLITRGGQAPTAGPPSISSFDPYAPNEETTPQADPSLPRTSRPLPPYPNQITSSPRSSPPKPPPAQRQQRRSADSPIGPIPGQNQYQPSQRDKEGSPLPQGGYRYGGAVKGNGPKGKSSPNGQSQTIVFDVAQPLDEIQAPRDAVKSTAIALVRVDSTFLSGTTIGATHWVAYAMTRGRVRVISRSSGDRTLLQLPPPFTTAVSVTDMSVHGNRLAGVTSDGGFVVWELPQVIRDDVPGSIMLCVAPTETEGLQFVKWHPQQPDLVAVASDTNMYLINIADAAHIFGGEPITQAELHRIGQVFSVPSPIVAFDYDVPRNALATISRDSTLTMWNIRDKLPFWSHKIRGDETPSSLTFVEGAVVVGRKNGTIFQLLPIMGRNILSTVKFINGAGNDPEMFGHVTYDSRIQTLWIANNRRESMIAFKINFDVSTPSPGGDDLRGAFFDQVVEFSGPKPTIHFVILTADADPTGEEAHAACIAAKVPPGELALVAFSVHSSGVDQVLIRKEWYTQALQSTPAKFPSLTPAPAPAPPPEPKRQLQSIPVGPPMQTLVPAPAPIAPPRVKTPTSEDVEGVETREDVRAEGKGKGPKGKNVGWKDEAKDAKGKGVDVGTESPLASTLSKEIKKSEENLHNRIGRLITKELEKQHQRLEDARANEQAADFVRQEKILKLISTELTKNTTRVVEMAVKAEVQASVLPSLENITKTEVKAALNNQISRGLSDSMKQYLPNEIEKLLLRPEVSSHIARALSSAVTPLVERQVKETITKTLIPAYSQQSSAMHQELSREIHSEILNLKKEIITWQSDALRGQESLIRELEHHPSHQSRSSPAPSTASNLNSLLRHPNLPPVSQAPVSYQQQQQTHSQFQQPPQQGPPVYGPWMGPTIAAPQASHPAAPPPIPAQSNMLRNTPPMQASEEWDDTYLAILGTQDARQLRELLARSNPDIVMPMNGNGPLSQAVVLTLVHRLSQLIGDTPPVDESFKSSLWWLQRASSILNTSDPLISPYVSRVLPNVQSMLNTTKQRLAILPGGPLAETARAIEGVQDLLSRKPI
ncbi:Enhancer of mRNA-decapping protein 4 C-terminal domain-containing protein [Abortiporus biennis]